MDEPRQVSRPVASLLDLSTSAVVALLVQGQFRPLTLKAIPPDLKEILLQRLCGTGTEFDSRFDALLDPALHGLNMSSAGFSPFRKIPGF
jgi:hypothetical protein